MNLPDTVRFIERDWLSSNQVLLFDAEQATVVDTGYGSHANLTCELIAHELANSPTGSPASLTRIINTHLHSDHCGANAALTRAWHCSIVVPAACEHMVATWSGMLHTDLAQQCERFTADQTLAPGDEFVAGGLTWQAHPAAGHDPTSLIFFAPQIRTLMSADALWEHGFGITFPELYGESGFEEQRQVLDLIETLNPALIIPGHGPVFTDLDAALTEARSRLAAYQADPLRNNRTAIKVLTKFVLLEAQQMTMDDLIVTTGSATIIATAARAMDMSQEDAVRWAVTELVRAGQASWRGDLICNAG